MGPRDGAGEMVRARGVRVMRNPSPRLRGEGGPNGRMRGGAKHRSNQMRTRHIPKFARAQTLRAASTEAEKKLWHRLRDRRLGGTKFVRQASIGPYYADFVCRACKLVIELDGSQHAESAYDDKRDAILIAQGYRVLLFWNAD